MGYPWAVPLLHNDGSDFNFCMSSIISKRWILTAAHCLTSFVFAGQVYGFLGAHDITSHGGESVYFDEMIIHSSYKSTASGYDIALLHTTEDIVFNDNVRAVCLPSDDALFDSSDVCVAVGWGRLYSDATNPDTLYQVRLPVVNTTTCKSTFSSLPDGVICAGDTENGGRDTCQGDSGGPLTCYQAGSWYHSGITSFGRSCGQKGSPGVYTDMRSYNDWIENAMSSFANTTDEDTTKTFDICRDTTVIGSSGTITSPLYPANYANDLDCSISIAVPEGQVVKVEFEVFVIENSTGCNFDQLSLEVGGGVVQSYCGIMKPSDFQSTEDILIRFISDDSVTLTGFKLIWSLAGGTTTVGMTDATTTTQATTKGVANETTFGTTSGRATEMTTYESTTDRTTTGTGTGTGTASYEGTTASGRRLVIPFFLAYVLPFFVFSVFV